MAGSSKNQNGFLIFSIRLGNGDQTFCGEAGRVQVRKQKDHAHVLLVFQGVFVGAGFAQPKVLHGMCVGRLFAGAMTLMKTKEASLVVIKFLKAIRIGAFGEHLQSTPMGCGKHLQFAAAL
jgi:hypothetical protein